MKIIKDKWVEIHYTLKDTDGNVLDTSVGGNPLGYQHGNGYLISGLEAELEGKEPGDKFSVTIPPKDAYGEYDAQMVVEVDRKQFDSTEEIEIGMMFQVMTPGGPALVRVIEINGEKIKIDANHELAGKTLHFDVEVIEVCEPTEEDLAPKCGGCGGGCSGDCGDCNSECEGCEGSCENKN